ncbi:MAG: hypothetical protein WDZ49_02300 [Litorilinea sp.]
MQKKPMLRLALLLVSICTAWLVVGSDPARAEVLSEMPPATLAPHANQIFLPQMGRGPGTVQTAACPTQSSAAYGTVPALGQLGRPAAQSGDVNLALRGYRATAAPLGLIDWNGNTDPNAPQIAAVFADRRAPRFTSAYRVYDWDWACGTDGCKGQPLTHWPVTLVGLQSQPHEAIHIPARGLQIYNGGYIALVLYAEETRLTVTYTRDDSPARGYVVHLEDFCVDPTLLAHYRQLDAAGRRQLPALRPQDPVGTAAPHPIKIAIRDEGSFMDPRSHKDWWAGY